MARIKRGTNKHRRHKKVLTLAKGYYGARSRHYKAAKENLLHAMAYAYADRRSRKGDMRSLWILRINAAARSLGITYGQLINGLNKANVTLDRKALAALAVEQPQAFAEVAAKAKAALGIAA
jgi:large subunit ribosomal protein L20